MTNGNGSGTKPITETIKALAGTPMLLVLVLINVLVIGMLTYLIKARADHLERERTEMLQALENCMNKLERDGDVHSR